MKVFFKSILVLTIILFSSTSNFLIAQPNYPTNPQNAELIHTDIQHFVEAYKMLNAETDTISVLKQYYFDKGSNGLREFINKHQLTPEMLKSAISKSPDEFAKIEEFLSNIKAYKEEFQKTMVQYADVLPSAMYPPTYLLVGANRGIGQASRAGQLITITRVVDNPNNLKKLIVHELSHFQQAIAMGPQQYVALYGKPNNMLDLCLREGGAEFITSLVLGEITQAKGLKYLENNEAELKNKFIEDLTNQDTKFWLWDSVDDPDTPHLLGYVMGFRICDSYFKKETNKTQALNDILLMKSPEEFVEQSEYFNP